ncbi:MAG: methyltransferase domain-containing protein [Magnetococcales bacterium]|nr:methyltransferase domain-containing protein [Magnetococcales bacterium]
MTKPHPLGTPQKIVSASLSSTNQVVFSMAEPFLDGGKRILDLGCGKGHMTRLLADGLAAKGVQAAEALTACDVVGEGYACHDINFITADLNKALPFASDSLDLIVSVEVMEHIHMFYGLLEECSRILRPDGVLIFSVPNILHVVSRLSFLTTGFYHMFIVPSTDLRRAGTLCGHVMPLSLAYLAYGLRRSGFGEIQVYPDRRKKSAIVLSMLFYPVFKLGSMLYKRKINKYNSMVYEENRSVIPAMNSFDMLTSRSCILVAKKR